MKLDWKHWILGLVAAVIGGGAGAITSGIGASVVTPEQYNFGAGLKHVLYLMAFNFVVSGIIAGAMYLKQSPVPREVWTEEERKAAASEPPKP